MDNIIMDTVNFREILTQMQNALECSICLELLNNPVSTKCDHQFCRFCITKFLQRKRSVPCPLCKVPVTKRSLQERSELSVVINNVQKLIAAYDRDTDMGQQPVLPPEGRLIAGTSSKQNKADKTQLKSSTKADSVNNDLYCNHTKTLVPGNGNNELLHKHQTFGMVPTTKSRPQFKPDTLTLNNASSVTEDCQRKRLRTRVMPDLNKSEHKDILSITQGKHIFEPASSESDVENFISGLEKKSGESIVSHDKYRIEHNNEHKEDMNNTDLLKYLEEGSCGAVFDDHPSKGDTNYECMESICGNLKTNMRQNKILDSNERHDHTIRNQEQPSKIIPCKKDDNSSEALDNDNNKKLSLRSARQKLPLSPSKSNTIECNSISVQLENSIFVHETRQDSEAKENVNNIKDSGLNVLPDLDDSGGISRGMTSPASEVSSVSSTQQLMKQKPVTARTYSRDMRKSFTGFVKNWADTLPHQSEAQKELNQTRGLTTKEKINAKKQNHQKCQPSKIPQAEVITNVVNGNRCLKTTDTVSCKVGLLNLNESSQVQFELPLTPVPRRRSIFKSHVQNTGTGVCDTKIIPHEDPYEFKGQTPVKSKRKIAGRKCARGDNRLKEVVEVIGCQEKSHKIGFKKVQTKQNIALDVDVSDKSSLFEDKKKDVSVTDEGNGNMVSGVCVNVPATTDKQETSSSNVQIMDVPSLKKSKMVHFSRDFEHINVSLNSGCNNTNDVEAENISETSTVPYMADICDLAKNQPHCRLSNSERVHLSDAQEHAAQNTATNTVSQNRPETSNEVVNDLKNAEHSLKLVKVTSKNSEVQINEKTVNLHTFENDTHLELPLNLRNRLISKTDHLHDKNAKSLLKNTKRTQKRKLSRQKPKTRADAETCSQKSGKELIKLIDKINEAEDYELMFNTQDVQQNLKKDNLQKEQLHSEAFGFGLLDSDVSNDTDAKDQSHCETSKPDAESTCDDSFIQEGIISFPVNCEKASMHKYINNSITNEDENCETNVENAMDSVKAVDFVKETPVSEDTSSSDTSKNADISVKRNITVEENVTIVSSATDAADIYSGQHFSNPQQPKQNISLFNNKLSVERRRPQYFSRPNLSLMILVSPSTKLNSANTDLVGSSNDDLVLGSILEGMPHKLANTDSVGSSNDSLVLGSVLDGMPHKLANTDSVGSSNDSLVLGSVLDGMPHKISKAVELICEESQQRQHGDNSNQQNINSKASLSSSKVLDDTRKEYNRSEQSTLDLHHAFCTQNVTRFPHSPRDIDETQKPLYYNPSIFSAYVKKTVDVKTSLGEEKSTSMVSNSAQLSLKSVNVSKSCTVAPNNKSTEPTNDALGSDIILAPDTCMYSYRGKVVTDDSGECLTKRDEHVILETLDLDTNCDENTSQMNVNSPSSFRLHESGQAETNSGALASNRTCVEAIAETQCLSNQSTVLLTQASLESVPEKCINNSHSPDLKESCIRTEMECPPTGTHLNLDPSNAKVQSMAIAETSQETVSGYSSQSQYILLPADKKSHVSGADSDRLNHSNRQCLVIPRQQTQLSTEQQFAEDKLSTNEAMPETPYTTISPKNQVCSAPDRLNLSESEDEDHVLIVRRTKRKCFSLNGSPLNPIVFGGGQKNIGGKLSVLSAGEKQAAVGADSHHNIEEKDYSVTSGGEHYTEMIGETEAMNVIDTWTEMEGDFSAKMSSNLINEDVRNQRENSVLEGETVEVHVREIEQVSHDGPKQLVEVTPIGKLKYIDSSGKYVVDLDDVSPALAPKTKYKKCLFSTTSNNHLTRSSAKRKHENDSLHQQNEVSIKLDDIQNEYCSKTRSSIFNELSVPKAIVIPESIDDSTCVDLRNDTKKVVVDNYLDSSESKMETEKTGTELQNSNVSCVVGKLVHTKRGLAKKGNLNSDSFVKHPRRCLSPASKAAIKQAFEKPASVASSHTDKKLSAETRPVDVIDVDAEFELCGSTAEQNKLSTSKTDSVCASHVKIVDMVHCLQTSDSEMEAQNISRKNKKEMAEVATKKVKKCHLAESQQEYNDEKNRLEKELFGLESNNRQKNGEMQGSQSNLTKSSFMENIERATHISGIHPLSLEDDDSELLFDLGDSTDEDDETAKENKGSVKTKTNLDKSKESEIVAQTGESIKSSGSLYLTSSPLEKADNNEHTDLNQTAISAIGETDTDDEENMYMWPKTRMKRHQIISDSDNSDQEEIQDKSPTTCTSSSAMSSQSEILTTEQQEDLEKDVAKLHQKIAEFEAKLGKLNINMRLTEASQENDAPKMSTVTVSDESSVGVPLDQDEDSNDLFLSPLPPSPPSRQANPKPVNRRPALSNSKKSTDQYMKQFQSPGGTVRTKKSLEFTVSSTISQSENKQLIPTKSVTKLTSHELNPEKGLKNDTEKLSSDMLQDVASKNMICAIAEPMEEVTDGQSTPEEKHNFTSVSPIMLSQKSRLMGYQSKKRDSDIPLTSLRSQPEKNVCLIASGLGRDEHLMVIKLVEKYGLKFCSKFSSAVTHVVMKPASGYDRVCDRTLKFFQGVAHKCWVVAFSWIADSIQAGSLLPEDNYEILGDTSGGESNLGVKRSRLCQEHLFTGFCFACVGDSREMPKESLHDLLAACGAVIVDDPISLISKVAKYKLIIRCSDSDVAPTSAELDMFNGLYRHMVLLTVMREWVLDSLGSYKLQPLVDYVINSDANICFPF